MSRNVALYIALRVARAVLPLIPLKVAYLLADLVALLAYFGLSAPRRTIVANLSTVTGELTTSRHVRSLARDAFANDAKNWIDTLRIHRVSDEEILRTVQVDGWERLDDALARGKGMILVGMHLGNFDLVGQVVAARGYSVTVPVERMQPAALFDLLTAERQSKGIRIVPIEQAPRAMVRALKDGHIVAAVGDRHVAGRARHVEFFGRPALLPTGPVALARRTGAPLLVGLGVREPSRDFHGFISETIEIQRTDDADLDDVENLARLVRIMEHYIRRFPGQWLVFSPVWPEERRATTVSIGHVEAKT